VIGQVYNMPPQPPVPENTRYLPAGVVTFGVEYRDVDPDALAATYASNAAHLAELEARSPAGGFSDEGVSIHVCGTDDGHEYLRFDVFDDEPHYHYVHPTRPGGELVNHVVPYDAVALGDMLSWTLERLRTRLPAMLTEADGATLGDRLDPAVVGPVIDEVEALATKARAAGRGAATG
jgi:hypothetical protein